MQQATEQQITSVWDAMEDTPQATTRRCIRSSLMMSLTEAIEV
jgi:predicted XRE-type DNA-binding protein